MADQRNASGRTSQFASILVMLALPQLCHAENAGGFLHFRPGELLVIGALIAVPSAILCVLAEAVLPRRRLPVRITLVAAAAAIAAVALAFFGSGPASAWPGRGSFVLAWFLVPPLVVLALRGALSDGLIRLALGWAIAFASLALMPLRHASADLTALAVGAAVPCIVLWSAVVVILRVRRIAPDQAVGFTQHVASFGAAMSRAFANAPLFRRAGGVAENQLARLQPAQKGLIWWFAGACVLYFGIGAATSAGKLGGGGWLYVEWQYVADLFGLRYPKDFRPVHVWWTLGLPWSLLAGSAFWGLAGLLGGFDPGRMRVVRFAAIVFGGALLVWTASIIIEMAEVSAREEQASGIRR